MEKLPKDPILDEKYILFYPKLGSGASAEVFLGEDINTKQKVAIKIMKLDPKIFEKEIKILNLIHHNNIVNIISSGEGPIIKEGIKSENYKYIVLEYAEKGDLFDYVFFPQSGFGEKIGKAIFKEILIGINSVHENNVAHRDLKMENIMLDKDFNIKIADFGFATLLSGNNGDGILTTPLGTRAYASPEILSKKPYNGIYSDIFSLGVVLFTLVTCKMPFGQATRGDKYYRLILLNQIDRYWEKLNSTGSAIQNLSEDFRNLFISMIKFKPEERPSIKQILESNFMKNDCANTIDVLSEFARREIIVKQQKELEKLANENEDYGDRVYRSDENEEIYFDKNIKVKQFKITHHCYNDILKVKGNIDYVKFMNKFANKIYKETKDKKSIEASDKYLKFKILYDDVIIEENNEKKENDNNEEEENEEEEEEIDIQDLIIDVKLKHNKENNEFYILFNKTSGGRREYFFKVSEIKEIALKLL
jgi:serine/threonine protein kinase